MKEMGSSTHTWSYYMGQTMKLWSAASPAEKLQKECRDEEETKAQGKKRVKHKTNGDSEKKMRREKLMMISQSSIHQQRD